MTPPLCPPNDLLSRARPPVPQGAVPLPFSPCGSRLWASHCLPWHISVSAGQGHSLPRLAPSTVADVAPVELPGAPWRMQVVSGSG